MSNNDIFMPTSYTTEKYEVRSIIEKIEKQYITAGEYLQNVVIKKLSNIDGKKKEIKARDFMQAQRGYTWPRYMASNFILTILRQKPIDEITLYRSDDKSLYKKTEDGQQRQTTLYLFVNNMLKLDMSKCLKSKFYIGNEIHSIKELQGKTFSELPELWQDLILSYSLRYLIKNNYTDEQAEDDYIEKSEGTKPLKAIEIRKAAMGTAVRKFVLQMLNNSWTFHALTVSSATGTAGLDIMTQFIALLNYNKPIEMSKENINEVIYNYRDFGLPQNIIDYTSLTCEYLNEVTNAWIEIKKELDKDQTKGRKVKSYNTYRFQFLNKTHILMLMWSAFVAVSNNIDVKIFQKWAYDFFSEPKGLYKEGLGDRSVKVSDLVSVTKRMQAIEEALAELKGEPLVKIDTNIQADTNDSEPNTGNSNNDNSNNNTPTELMNEQTTLE